MNLNLKSRLEKIENEFSSILNGIPECRLFEHDFEYTGEPYNSLKDLFEGLNVTSDFSPYYTSDDYKSLFQKNLLSINSPEMQSVEKTELIKK